MEKNRSIPVKDADFHVAQDLTVTTAYANRQKWKLDIRWLDEKPMPEKQKWNQTWQTYINPATRNPAVTFAKTQQRKTCEKLLRLRVKILQSNTHVPPEQLQLIGIAKPSSGKTPAPIAHASPDEDTDTPVIGHEVQQPDRRHPSQQCDKHWTERF